MEDQNILDSILVEIGEFGKYQKMTSFFILIAAALTYCATVIFVFETKQVNHRCEIFVCDSNSSEFEPSWWRYAIPAENGKPSKCSKYRRRNNDSITCDADDFDKEIKESCEAFIYETSEISILHDFNLQCEENIWKLTLVGTIHGAGLFVGLPISGMLSDRFGRKTVLIGALVSSGILGIIRSFSVSYMMFMVFEILDAICRAGGYAICFILAVELVGPKKRVFMTLLVNIVSAFGVMFQGGLAWILQTWRTLDQIMYALFFVGIFYYWLIPESVRWLLTQKRFHEAKHILKKVAKINGKSISPESLNKLEMFETSKEKINTNSVREIFTSRIMMFRIVICSICWMCCIFLYNGLTINSVQLSGNSYLDFILSIFVEIPGNIISFLIVDRIGRRITLIGGFLIAGLSCIGSIFIPGDIYWLKLLTYLLGKFGSSINISAIYNITSEMFPTPFRNSLLGTCSMFGRIGSMVGPQMPLLEIVWKPLPLLLFGSSGILAAFLMFFLPETMNTKLPSTIKEAEEIEKESKIKK